MNNKPEFQQFLVEWVFFISFEKRKWFTWFWKNRTANTYEIQVFNIHMIVGMPWHEEFIKRQYKDSWCSDWIKSFEQTNAIHQKHLWPGWKFKRIYTLPTNKGNWSERIAGLENGAYNDYFPLPKSNN